MQIAKLLLHLIIELQNKKVIKDTELNLKYDYLLLKQHTLIENII